MLDTMMSALLLGLLNNSGLRDSFNFLHRSALRMRISRAR